MPPAYDIPVYPGHAAKEGHTFQHSLRMIARLFFLYELARMTPEEKDHFLDSLINGSKMTSPGKKDARIFGAKVVAIPDELSDGEYASLAAKFMIWSMTSAHIFPSRFGGIDMWTEWASCNAQGPSSPALMKWKAVETKMNLGTPGGPSQ